LINPPTLAGTPIRCDLALRPTRLTAQRSQRTRSMVLPLAYCAAISWLTLPAPVCAQTPAPARAASAPAAAPDQSYSVYRWIKLQADAAPRKAETVKVKPKSEPAVAAVRKPEAQATAAPASVERSEGNAAEAATSASAQAEPAPQAPASALPAASAQLAAATVAAPALPPVEEVEAELKLISQTQPEFPRELRRSISQGKVMVAFTVQPNGTVAGASVLSSTNRKLGKPATEAVSKWVFEPIRSARTAQVEIEFNLQ